MKTCIKPLLALACAFFCLTVMTPQNAIASDIDPVAFNDQENNILMRQLPPSGKKKKIKLKKEKKVSAKDAKASVSGPETVLDPKQSQANTSLPIYNPANNQAPAEGIEIKETNFCFSEPLLVRPKTDMLVIHHVGIPDGDTSAAAIHRAHQANGWAGIGYHYVIRKNGVIERGRPLATVGAHAYGENYHTVGINVTGNFEKEAPTAAQMKSLTELVTALCKIYSIDPGSRTIVGHRNLNSTECPGKNLYRQLPRLRDDVQLALFAEKLKGVHLLKLKKYENENSNIDKNHRQKNNKESFKQF